MVDLVVLARRPLTRSCQPGDQRPGLVAARPGPGPGRESAGPWSCTMCLSPWAQPGAWSWVRLVVVLDRLGWGLGAAWHWWWARHLHRLGGVTCMFVISLTFWVSIGGVVGISFWWCLGWWEGVLGVSRPVSGCDLSVADGSVRTASGSGHIRLPDRRDQSIPPRSGRETGPGSRSLPGLSAGGDPPGSGCHSYQDHGPEEALRSHPGRCHSGGWEDRMDYEASAPSRGPATGSRMRRWPGTMEQGATLVVGRSGWILLLVPESTG